MICIQSRLPTGMIQEPAVFMDNPSLFTEEPPSGRSGHRNPVIQSREMDSSLEETLLAFLDTHGARDLEDIEEDNLTFLEATYARCGVRADANVPTQKMFAAIFRIIQESESVELTMASFQLLKYLEKRHPRVAIATEEGEGSSGQPIQRLHVDRRVWSPIEHLIEEMGSKDRMLREDSAEAPIPLNLVTLLQTIVMSISEEGSRLMSDASSLALNSHSSAKRAGRFLMLQHLVGLIENNHSCCLQVYKANMDNSPVQKSYVYRLLCALPADVRNNFLSNLVFLLNPTSQHMETDEELPNCKDSHGRDPEARNKPGLLPSTSDFSHLAYRLLLMVMEIDHVIRNWNRGNSRSMRRGSFPDDVLSIFSDAQDLESYLEALDSPRTKLRFIVDYFIASVPVDMIVKGLKDIIDRVTFEKLLGCFGEDKTKRFLHKFGENVLPVVLAHGFQAFLIIHIEAAGEDDENQRQAKLLETSLALVEILTELRELEGQTEMLPVAEHAIQMAESIVNQESFQEDHGQCQ